MKVRRKYDGEGIAGQLPMCVACINKGSLVFDTNGVGRMDLAAHDSRTCSCACHFEVRFDHTPEGRAASKAYAEAHHFFWHECPRCGRWYGGHETSGRTVQCTRSSSGHVTCCAEPAGTPINDNEWSDEPAVCARDHERGSALRPGRERR